MNALFKTIKEDNIIFWSIIISCILLVGTVITIIFSLPHLPSYLPLYNKLPWGYARVGGKYELFVSSGVTLICIGVNSIITGIAYKKVPLLSRLLAATTIAITLFTTLYTIQIIRSII